MTAPLDIDCDACGAGVGERCWQRAPEASPHAWTPTDTPCPDRVAAARLASAQEGLSRDFASIDELALIDQIERRKALLRAYDALPHGFDALVRVLEHGAKKYGSPGPSPDQTAAQHIEHALDHARNAHAVTESRDLDTGELDATHAGARAVLAVEVLERAEKGGR